MYDQITMTALNDPYQDRMRSFSFPNVSPGEGAPNTFSQAPRIIRRNSAQVPSTYLIAEDLEEDYEEGQDERPIEAHECDPLYSKPTQSPYFRKMRTLSQYNTPQIQNTTEKLLPIGNNTSKLPGSPLSPQASRRLSNSASYSPRRDSQGTPSNRMLPASSAHHSLNNNRPHSISHRRSGSLSGAAIKNDLTNLNQYSFKPLPGNGVSRNRSKYWNPGSLNPEEAQRMISFNFNFDNKSTIRRTEPPHMHLSSHHYSGSADEREQVSDDESDSTSLNSVNSQCYSTTTVGSSPSVSRKRSIVYKISCPTDVVLNLDDIYREC